MILKMDMELAAIASAGIIALLVFSVVMMFYCFYQVKYIESLGGALSKGIFAREFIKLLIALLLALSLLIAFCISSAWFLTK